MLDVTRLRVLVAVARCGSVTAAARELNYAQPSVSHHLARLEAETGIKLIERAGRGIRLTDAGRLLAERGRERRQPEPPGAQSGVGGQLVLGGVQPADHLGGPLGEQPSGVGEPDPAARPLDQLGPGLGLQPGQVVAHRRLRVVERPRRGGDRTVPGHGDQHAQPGHVEHAPTIDRADRSAQSA